MCESIMKEVNYNFGINVPLGKKHEAKQIRKGDLL